MHRKKRPLTLLELMIVIVLIGLIGSVIGFNMKGSLDEGRAFKTRQGQEQVRDILMLEVARGTPVDEVVEKRLQYIQASGLVKRPEDFLKDGWGIEYEVRARANGEISVRSPRLRAYDRRKSDKLGKPPVVEEGDEQ